MTKLSKTSLKGKFKNVFFLNAQQAAKFSNLVLKEFERTTDQHKAFDLVQISKEKNFSFAHKLEQKFNSKFYPNIQ